MANPAARCPFIKGKFRTVTKKLILDTEVHREPASRDKALYSNNIAYCLADSFVNTERKSVGFVFVSKAAG